MTSAKSNCTRDGLVFCCDSGSCNQRYLFRWDVRWLVIELFCYPTRTINVHERHFWIALAWGCLLWEQLYFIGCILITYLSPYLLISSSGDRELPLASALIQTPPTPQKLAFCADRWPVNVKMFSMKFEDKRKYLVLLNSWLYGNCNVSRNHGLSVERTSTC